MKESGRTDVPPAARRHFLGRRALQIVWLGVQRVGRGIGRFNTTLILTLSFYLLLMPISLIRRLFVSRPGGPPRWEERRPSDRRHFERQY
jgi:hypothetical protein